MGGAECNYKFDYATKGEAMAAARLAARNHRSTKPLRPYKCPACGLFHLTHNDQETRKDRNARTD